MSDLARNLESSGMSYGREKDEYLFASPHCGIRAHGIFDRLMVPVTNSKGHNRWLLGAKKGTNDEDCIHNQLKRVFCRAREAGIGNPIAIGAIPFDKTQPAELSVPCNYEIFSSKLNNDFSIKRELNSIYTHHPVVVNKESLPDQQRFKQAVRQIIANISVSDIRKAVLSRILELELSRPIDLADFFERLIGLNPHAYHFRIPLSDGAQLIGASPELLLRRQGNYIYTNPLAGSAKRQVDADEDKKAGEELVRSSKDAHEHQLVIEDIRTQLQSICREVQIPDGPQLLKTSTMWHLSTPIRGILNDPEMTALQVACLLHPTPALCGYPTDAARKLIHLVEPFNRGMFGGIVGWCDAEGNGEWAVAIRCGIFSGNRVQLFAGAGIVDGSDPESEWEETQAKLQTMLNALEINVTQDKSVYSRKRSLANCLEAMA